MASTPATTALPDTGALSSLEFDAWRGFMVTHRRLLRELDRELARGHGLPMSSYEALMMLSDAPDGGRMRMKQLAEALQVSPSGLTRTIDDLERRGLVERESCPSDARGMWAVITRAGRAAFRKARATHLAGVRERFAGRLDDEQLTALVGVWHAVGLDSSGAECGSACGDPAADD